MVKGPLVVAWTVLTLSNAKPLGSYVPLLVLRGGSYYETNPNYQPRHTTLGDLEKRRPTPPPPPQEFYVETYSAKDTARYSITTGIQNYFTRLHRISPTLSLGTVACCVVFCLSYNPPFFHSLWVKYFVCSRFNVLQEKRFPALLLYAVAHLSFVHLLVNLLTYNMFGPLVKQTLAGWPLWPMVVGAAITTSCFHMFTKTNGCVGLSGVAFSLVAFDAQANPQKELRLAGIVPIRTRARYVLAWLLLWSFMCSFLDQKSNMAHSAHFGGLLFGVAYYELWLRRHDILAMTRRVKRSLLNRRRRR